MRLSVRFPESFYEKYADYIKDKSNFKVMAYVLGFIDKQIGAPKQQAQQQQVQEGSLQEQGAN